MASNAELTEALERFVLGMLHLTQAEGIDQLIEMDLSFSQARTLFTVGHAPEPLPIHAIAEKLSLSMAAAGRNVDRLVRLDLVSRTESPEDRRVKLVALTDRGRDVLYRQFETKRASVRAFVDRLGAAERDTLHAAIAAVLASGAIAPDRAADHSGDPL